MGKADGHVAVSREIEINLIGVAESAQPGASCAECRERSQPGIDYGSDSIGDEDFLNKADNEVGPADVETAAAICQIKMLEVVFDLPEAHDWSGNKLRKQRHVAGEFEDVFCRLNGAAVTINDIADGVECVKRNPYWQQGAF